MLTELRSLLSQPLMLDGQVAAVLHAALQSGKTDGLRGLFVSAPCPMAAAENAVKMAAGESSRKRATAVLPVFGMITQHASFFNELMGGTTLDSLSRAFDMVMNEPRITDVVFQFHTPGGEVFGVKEFADKMFTARGIKPMAAVVDSRMSSAGYYLGAAADRVYITPFGKAGSIGVMQVHVDESQSLEKEGLKASVARIPEFKGEGNPFEPLSDEAKAHTDATLATLYDHFTADIARYRGTTQAHVKEHYGKGREMDAKSAVAAGMANKIATFDQVLQWSQAGTIARSIAQGPTAMEEDHEGPRMDARDPSLLKRKMALAGVAQ